MYTDYEDDLDDSLETSYKPYKTPKKRIFNFKKIKTKLKKFFSSRLNIIITVLSVLILIFGILYINNLVNGEEDFIIYDDYVDGR